jgi:multiple sugar transport system ATP-binding protein
VRNAERSVISAGQTVGVQLPVEHCYLFDGDGNAFQRLSSTQNKH